MSSVSNEDVLSGHGSLGNATVALQTFRELVAGRTGISIPESDEPKIRRLLIDRAAACGMPSFADYCRLLQSVTVKATIEWEMLHAALTVPETYFFRDEQLFRLLRLHLLPGIIGRNRDKRTLCLWSAGCSTGEEAYSLAMVVDQLLPASVGWQVTILGTDLNATAVAQAGQGVYPAWSVSRSREPLLRRYCQGGGATWVVDRRIREMVRFQQGNLVADPLPAPEHGISGLDIILCRNVFIYFTPAAAPRVLDKLVACLRPEGYLLTGPGDMAGKRHVALRPLLFPEAVVYQRIKPPVPSVAARPAALTLSRQSAPCAPAGRLCLPPSAGSRDHSASASGSPDPEAILAVAGQAFREGDYQGAIARAGDILALAPRHAAAHYLIAWAHANRGDMVRAEQWALRAIDIDSLAVSPHYLLAQLREAQADQARAKVLLNKVIYLDPHFIPAYLDLAAIYAAEGQEDKARRKRLAARALIRTMRSASPREPYVVLRSYDELGEL